MAEKLAVIIDNRSGSMVLRAFQKLLPNLQKIDMAIGVSGVGSLLLLEGLLQNIDKIRFLMGDETNKRTRREIAKVRRAREKKI